MVEFMRFNLLAKVKGVDRDKLELENAVKGTQYLYMNIIKVLSVCWLKAGNAIVNRPRCLSRYVRSPCVQHSRALPPVCYPRPDYPRPAVA
jgi:hypothetical protein